jgi:uncharacterized protein
MELNNFIGRDVELDILKETLNNSQTTITVIYGRRRIGKSFLIQKATEYMQPLVFEGVEGQSKESQLDTFRFQLSHQTNEKIPKFKQWRDAFLSLLPFLKENPRPLVFDEFQWMANYRSEIVSDLKMVWDQYLSKISGVSIILCGSIASFMKSRVIRSSALYGRVDRIIHLKEFSLYETSKMLPDLGFTELLLTYQMVGGIPKYHELIRPYPSLYIAMENLAFNSYGYFFSEFQRIFVSHFGKNPDHEKIITVLAEHPYGMFRKELAKAAGISTGGSLTEHLTDLESAGFINSSRPLGSKANTRLIKYYISDAYTTFYFTFIKPNLNRIKQGPPLSINTLFQGGVYQNWRGRSFELVFIKHALSLTKLLGFSGIDYQYGPYFRAKSKEMSGVQIDLLFNRSDNVLTLCEMKSQRAPIGEEVIIQIERKVQVLSKAFPGKTIQSVLIHDGPITNKTKYSPILYKAIPAQELLKPKGTV